LKLLLENWRGYIEEESQIEREGSRKKLKPAKVTWSPTNPKRAFAWLVDAKGWKLSTEKGDWFDEPDEEFLKSITILNQEVEGTKKRAEEKVRDKLEQLGYVENEDAYWEERRSWLASRGTHKEQLK